MFTLKVILIEVSGSPEHLRHGVPVTLRGIASYPLVDFDDIHSMFSRIDIIDHLNFFGCAKHVSRNVYH